jgi:hypothetical protein
LPTDSTERTVTDTIPEEEIHTDCAKLQDANHDIQTLIQGVRNARNKLDHLRTQGQLELDRLDALYSTCSGLQELNPDELNSVQRQLIDLHLEHEQNSRALASGLPAMCGTSPATSSSRRSRLPAAAAAQTRSLKDTGSKLRCPCVGICVCSLSYVANIDC